MIHLLYGRFVTRLFVVGLGITLLLCSPTTGWAGAWAQEEGGLYLKASAAHEGAELQYKETGEVFQLLSEDDRGSFSASDFSVYGEYGVVPRFTVYASSSFRRAVIDSTQIHAEAQGVGDIRAGGKYQFLDEPLVLSASVAGKLPSGYDAVSQDPRMPTLGNGVFELEGRVLIAKSFYPAPFYVSAEGGYRHRGSRSGLAGTSVDYDPELPFFVELAYAPADWVWARGLIEGVYGLGDPRAIGFSLTPLTQSYTRIGPSLLVKLNELYQLNLDFLYTIHGVNSLQSYQVSVGFAFDTTL